MTEVPPDPKDRVLWLLAETCAKSGLRVDEVAILLQGKGLRFPLRLGDRLRAEYGEEPIIQGSLESWPSDALLRGLDVTITLSKFGSNWRLSASYQKLSDLA